VVVGHNLANLIRVVVEIFLETDVGVGDGQRNFRHDVTQCLQRLVLLLVLAALAKGRVGRTKMRAR